MNPQVERIETVDTYAKAVSYVFMESVLDRSLNEPFRVLFRHVPPLNLERKIIIVFIVNYKNLISKSYLRRHTQETTSVDSFQNQNPIWSES